MKIGWWHLRHTDGGRSVDVAQWGTYNIYVRKVGTCGSMHGIIVVLDLLDKRVMVERLPCVDDNIYNGSA
jgi:hypothetical protein